MWLLLVPIAYLLGTFPSAALIARASGIDIRSVGSGNPGASNVTRALGWRKGAWVFALDAAKGALATGIGLVAGGRPGGYVLGAAAIVGHVFPVWTRFRGGKGVATGGGALAVIAPITFVTLAVVWFVLLKLTHKASVASIAATVLVPVGVAIEHRSWWEVLAVIGLGALVMARHLGNIKRLIGRHEHALTN
jgi:acyl phosphate:glycerol-3-phosphate acyltransferase